MDLFNILFWQAFWVGFLPGSLLMLVLAKPLGLVPTNGTSGALGIHMLGCAIIGGAIEITVLFWLLLVWLT